MNDRQKEILQSQLNREKRTIEELKRVYAQASRDCEAKIRELSARTDMENLQSIIYQKQYQEVLKKQIDNVLEQLHTNEFTTVQDYLVNCYNDGYLGVMYDLAGQGIPFIIPINQEQVVKALQTDSKISTSLYTRLGEDVKQLKTNIRAQLSRGIANGSSWNDIAVTIANNMKSDYNKAYNNAIRITRTEGHRVQCQSAYDAQVKAKEKGADVVKQWDATLDGKTRPSHRMVDGEIKELDEPFSNGLMKPGDSGAPAEEVVNCRCALLQRARWALDEAELETLKERADYYGLDKTENFDEFKSKYLNAAQQEADDAQKTKGKDTLENIGKSSKIKSQEGQTKHYTKINVEDIPSMDEQQFAKIKEGLEKQGISVIQDVDGDAFLKAMNAEAMTLSDGSAIIFQSGRTPSASAVFEETIHSTQIRKNGMITTSGDVSSTMEYLNREIEANEKLLKNKDAYKLTELDVESVQENLNMYYEKLKEVKQNV